MGEKSLFREVGDDVDAGDSLEVGPSDAGTGAVLLNNIVYGAACDIELVATVGETEVAAEVVDSFDSAGDEGISQDNGLELVDGMKCRIKNTSGSPADYVATGEML